MPRDHGRAQGAVRGDGVSVLRKSVNEFMVAVCDLHRYLESLSEEERQRYGDELHFSEYMQSSGR